MKIQYWTLLGAACLTMGTRSVMAQHQHTPKCAVNRDMAAMIKSRMMEERARFSQEEIQQMMAQRGGSSTTYIPLTLHIVGDNTGSGYADLDDVLDMFCGLQQDYLTQNIQYYLNGQFRYINNTTLYNNAFSVGGNSVMNSNKVSNSLNAYVGPSINDQSASFYQPNWGGAGDYVFLLTAQMLDATPQTAPTTSHEFGHFFTLPHTFDGWEGTNYDDVYAGANAPVNIGGVPVERVARTNCLTAGDGFCDTEADYFSDRTPCPYTGVAKDPIGTQLDPDETNIMSYFYDACVNNFSTEQKTAITTNITNRGWTNFTPPTTVELTGAATLVSPAHNSQVNLLGATDITLTWDAMPDATGYYIEVDRSFNGSPIESILKAVVYNTTSYTFPASSLQALKQYRWKVRPFNAVYTCPSTEAAFNFITVSVTTGVDDVETVAGLTMEAMPNPVTGEEVRIAIQSQKDAIAGVRLYSMEGKLLVNMENEAIYAGETNLYLPTNALPNGVYVLTLTTEWGSSQQKIVVNR